MEVDIEPKDFPWSPEHCAAKATKRLCAWSCNKNEESIVTDDPAKTRSTSVNYEMSKWPHCLS